MRRRAHRLPFDYLGYPSYLKQLTAADLVTLFERQGGQCPITHGGFFLPSEPDLPAPQADLLNSLTRRIRSDKKEMAKLTMEPTRQQHSAMPEMADAHLPWPVRIRMSAPFESHNLMLIKYFMVDAYYHIGGLDELRTLLGRIPSADELRAKLWPEPPPAREIEDA